MRKITFFFTIFTLYFNASYNLESINVGTYTSPNYFKDIELPDQRIFAPTEYEAIVVKIAESHDIDIHLFCAIIKTESNWDAEAVGYNSDSFDYGFCQVNNRYDEWYAEEFSFDNYDRYNPIHNLLLGAKILKWCGEKLDSTEEVIAAYNCGRGSVLLGKIPESTIEYTSKVMEYYIEYKEFNWRRYGTVYN